MLKNLEGLKGFSVVGDDGKVFGNVEDFNFYSPDMAIKYIVVDTGSWLDEREVIFSPECFKEIDYEKKEIHIGVCEIEVKDSPELEKDRRVTRKKERKLVNFFNWPDYWGLDIGAGVSIKEGERRKLLIKALVEDEYGKDIKKDRNKSRVKRTSRLKGFQVNSIDGEIGAINDIIIDDKTWLIRYFVVNTKSKLKDDKPTLIAPEWVEKYEWSKNKISIIMSKEEIENAPELKNEKVIETEYQEELYDHYDKKKFHEL